LTKKIYILLPVHNRKAVTATFVDSLKAQTFRDYHLVLIDDGSTDGTAEMVTQAIPSTTVLRGTGGWWWAGSLQRGLEWLKQEQVPDDAVVLFINDDVQFNPDYLDRAAKVMQEKRGVLVLSKTRDANTGKISETGVTADLRRLTFKVSESAESINCLPTRGLFAHWGDVRKIGGFHPRLLPHYLSDYEYTMRAHKLGLKCESSSALLIISNEETTGYRKIEETGFRPALAKLLSKKAPSNPFYWSTFVVLAAPPRLILPGLLRVWTGAGKWFLRFSINRFSPPRKAG
jgi:GT2 family glycosyltransferase